MKVYHDGKLCREYEGKVLARRAQGIKVTFECPWVDEVMTAWFRRRRKSGVYEAIGLNFWLYT